jgi:threonine aldolase
MFEAVVGDEQRGEDPTVNELLERTAALLGQERAIFLPSGTMCNQIAFAVHCRPGDEIVAAANSHIVSSEGAGAAVFSGAVIRGIESKTGVFTGEQLAAAVRTVKPKVPRTTVVSVEQTTNRGGGTVWKGAQLKSIVNIARERGLILHMDGARLMNAAVSSEEDIKTYTSLFDSVWIDFTKGLGCPVGSVLAGSKDFISRAEHWKHRFGGAMRQAGILAAAAIYALEFNCERLTEDHHNARQFATSIANLTGLTLPFSIPETNIVFVNVQGLGVSASEFSAKLREKGVRVGVEDTHQLRAVFHLDISQEKTQKAIQAFSETVSELADLRAS